MQLFAHHVADALEAVGPILDGGAPASDAATDAATAAAASSHVATPATSKKRRFKGAIGDASGSSGRAKQSRRGSASAPEPEETLNDRLSSS